VSWVVGFLLSSYRKGLLERRIHRLWLGNLLLAVVLIFFAILGEVESLVPFFNNLWDLGLIGVTEFSLCLVLV
jgi:hypothetical protein